MAEQTTAPQVRTDLPEPAEEQVDHLASVITDAWVRGINAGHWTLARAILAAGYRLIPEPEPPQWGECRACGHPVRLNEHGALIEHEDRRRKRPCIGAFMVPLRHVPAPEQVADRG